MGLFSFFSSKKYNNILHDMKDYLCKFMAEYAVESPESMPDVAGIFANTQIMLDSLSPKDIKKAIKANGVTAECGVLNIIQNYAMYEIKSTTEKDLLFGEKDEAYDLYIYVNEKKLKLNYISNEQYQDNKRLGFCLKTGKRPII